MRRLLKISSLGLFLMQNHSGNFSKVENFTLFLAKVEKIRLFSIITGCFRSQVGKTEIKSFYDIASE